MAVVLCTLRWLGFVPDKVSVAPPVVVARLAEQLSVDAAEIRVHGAREVELLGFFLGQDE
jgi:hypothetical protein